jgi:DNA-directed RNA polymerase delta subunit
MAKISKATVDATLRMKVFNVLLFDSADEIKWAKINDRQYGCLLTDLNGETRYVRIGAIVAEQREDMTAEELMQSEIDAYNAKQEEKTEKARKKADKIARDKAKREKEKEEKENVQ